MNLQPFQTSQVDSIIQFAAAHPWRPVWSKEFILEFLTQLISDPGMVFDVYSKKTRIAVAVLVDQIQNPGNNACLEILGMDRTFESIPYF